jgi:1,4-dihydroxy-2-naphthoyl-CoA hydrolase
MAATGLRSVVEGLRGTAQPRDHGYRARVALEPPIPLEKTFDGLYGLEVLEVTDELVRGRVEVRDELRQMMGILHGGVLAAMAESLTSGATGMVVVPEGKASMGQSNHTTFLRPVLGGSVTATGRRRHRGRTTWIWDVDFTDDEGRLCAVSRIIVAVRDLPA